MDASSSNPFLHGATYPADAKIAAYDWFDLSLAARIAKKYTLRVGAINIFDRDPPIIGSANLPGTFGNGNTLPQAYDALGPYVYAAVSLAF